MYNQYTFIYYAWIFFLDLLVMTFNLFGSPGYSQPRPSKEFPKNIQPLYLYLYMLHINMDLYVMFGKHFKCMLKKSI